MDSKQLKGQLLNDPTLIVSILEELGCHEIKIVPNKRVTAALPDGDNPSSVQVLLLDENLTTIVHTRGDYEGGDIFSFVSYIRGCNFRNSMMLICRLLNIDYDFKYVEKTVNETYNFLKQFIQKEVYQDVSQNEILDESVLNDYIRAAHINFVEDNLTVDSQYKFGIHYDINSSRILIPIRDLDGNLVTIKGRTTVEGYKEKDIMKYLAYYEYHARHILYGYYENYWDIVTSDEIILVESEKAVIQADGYGVNNIVALSKWKVSEEQLFKIISLNKDVVLALDKNIGLEELELIAREFKGLCDVYAVYDYDDLLGEKESPLDRGEDVWNTLYENKIKII